MPLPSHSHLRATSHCHLTHVRCFTPQVHGLWRGMTSQACFWDSCEMQWSSPLSLPAKFHHRRHPSLALRNVSTQPGGGTLCHLQCFGPDMFQKIQNIPESKSLQVPGFTIASIHLPPIILGVPEVLDM